jgi:KDO2-lipid IV(A) lauroyltransferase
VIEGSQFAVDGAFWRRCAALGARRFPRWWMRYSPPFFGLAAAVVVPGARRAVRRNLEHIRGPAPLWRDALETAETFTNYASCLSEALARGSKNGGSLATSFVGGEHMHDAVAQRRGVLVLTMHTAGWEVATPLWFRDTNVEVLVVMEREKNTRAQAIQDAPRATPGVRFVHVGDDPLAALPILRHLENKGAVGIQIDRLPGNGRTVGVELMGRPYSIPEGPLRIAQLSGAPLLPSFSARLGFHEYHARTYPPMTVARRASRSELERTAQQIADAMGDFLRRFPTQWFHFGP